MMKKTILSNTGVADQGKSDTIKRAAKKILAAYPHAVVTPAPVNYSGDITLQIDLNGILIGIESQGDPNSNLFGSLRKFAKAGCDIVICSTRTSGATYDEVTAMHTKHGYDVIRVANYRSHEKQQGLLNQLSADHLFELLQAVLSGRV